MAACSACRARGLRRKKQPPLQAVALLRTLHLANAAIHPRYGACPVCMRRLRRAHAGVEALSCRQLRGRAALRGASAPSRADGTHINAGTRQHATI